MRFDPSIKNILTQRYFLQITEIAKEQILEIEIFAWNFLTAYFRRIKKSSEGTSLWSEGEGEQRTRYECVRNAAERDKNVGPTWPKPGKRYVETG